jgi:crossover junction endodeoxyribonuclease RuvC
VSTVLGLDPGTRHFGWGVVAKNGTRLTHIAHGVCDVEKHGELGDRLVAIEQQLLDVIARYKPTHASIETMFFAKDASAATKLAHARGVALLVCARAGLPPHEYQPTRVKRTVVGAGRADKDQIAQMVRVVLGLPECPRSDAADALAIAMTHLQGTSFAANPGRNGAPPGFARKKAKIAREANPHGVATAASGREVLREMRAILRAGRPSNR